MARDNTVTVIGNITRDPELRYTQGGQSLASFGLAWNNRYQRDGERVEDRGLEIEAGSTQIYQVGKRKYARVTLT